MTVAYYIGALILLLVCIVILCLLLVKYRQRYKAEATVTYFATSLFGQNTIDDILWDIAKNCIRHLDFEDCVIYLLDAERQVLVQKAAYGPKNPVRFEIKHPIEIPVGQGITGAVALTGKAEIILNTAKDERYILDDERRQSEITVPIFYEQQVIGVIDSEHSRKGFYTARHLHMLEKIAAICGAKIGKTLIEEKAQLQAAEVQQLHRQLAEFRLVTLKSQMNPHFLFNCLNGIYNCMLTCQLEKAQEYISNFSRLLRMVLIHSEKNFISLRDEMDLLQYYLKIESLRTDHAFAYTMEIEENINPRDYFVPGMLIQPFLENAIWHGLMNKSGERQLHIHWRYMNEHVLLCEITDNGIGRNAAAQQHGNGLKTGNHQSRGMQLCQERVDLYKSLFNTRFSIQVSDLVDEGNQPAGTRVDIAFEMEPGMQGY
ncbi:GAF domain-containing protein [Chitinophaga agrisoli]|uniref:GAF domain-containing protein n=1 Tax=Chitinophaga agrisoli TaxID=2607653 RepID=A0A5B2W2N9_9BACT|nr:histidine kinase [Chitinophaga agrisoli]KAA2244952.1 GAF domain-containing protein [Chitinophaga agrisoli]